MEDMLVAAVQLNDFFAVIDLEFFVADDAGVVVRVCSKVLLCCLVSLGSQEEVSMWDVFNNSIETCIFI